MKDSAFELKDKSDVLDFGSPERFQGKTSYEVSLASDRKRKFEAKKGAKLEPYFCKNGFDLPVHEKLANCFPLFEFDAQLLGPVLAALPIKKRPIAERQAECWMAHQYFLTVGDTRRIYSSAANMKKELRAILKCGQEEVCEIDVSCCQPVLLSQFLKGNISDAEYRRYVELTQTGALYGQIANDIGETRDSVKKAMVKWMCGPRIPDEPNPRAKVVSHKDIEKGAEHLKLPDSTGFYVVRWKP